METIKSTKLLGTISTLFDPRGGGGPKDPQLSKSLKALNWVFESG